MFLLVAVISVVSSVLITLTCEVLAGVVFGGVEVG